MQRQDATVISMKISIVILTYKRKALLLENLAMLDKLTYPSLEIIVADNCSEQSIAEAVHSEFPRVRVLSLNENVGTEGRNQGIAASTGEVVIGLDDDVFGITDAQLAYIAERFGTDTKLGALCFQVRRAQTQQIINWCHHYPKETYADKTFDTNEITEGAVALNRGAFKQAGGYPGHFFISHEGPDLAIRLMNAGYHVEYTPNVVVNHHESTLGRPGWRRYYYDTRNTIWLVIRNYPIWMGLKMLAIQLTAMLIYSLRDGFLKYWFLGVWDALKQFGAVKNERRVMPQHVVNEMNRINANRPPFWTLVKQRLFQKRVGI